MLMNRKTIERFIKVARQKSVNYITKLIPKAYSEAQEGYQESRNTSDNANDHPIVYEYPLQRTDAEKKAGKKPDKVNITIFGRDKRKGKAPNKSTGKTIIIKLYFFNPATGLYDISYLYDVSGKLHTPKERSQNPCINNDVFIPIEGNPGKKCRN